MKEMTLSAEEIIDLIFEKKIQKDDLKISASDSFLTIISRLHDEMQKEFSND